MSRIFEDRNSFEKYLGERDGQAWILIAEACDAREYQVKNGFLKYEERFQKLRSLTSEILSEGDAVAQMGESLLLIAIVDKKDKQSVEEAAQKLSARTTELFNIAIGGAMSQGTSREQVLTAMDKAIGALEQAKNEGISVKIEDADHKTRVMIVEDQNLVRQLFERTVQESDRYELMYSIRNADLADVYCQKGNIDLILMDVYTDNGANGLAAAGRIKRTNPEIKIIIITSMPEFTYLDRARAAGVESFVYKELNTLPLLDVMDRTIAGESIYPDRTPEVMIGKVSSYDLSDRELQILKELTSGDSNEQIAERLYISVATVKTHIANIMLKSGFKNRTELAIKARESGLVIKDD